MNKLYIVGNGFDLHHGLRSSFRDFGRFLHDSSPGLAEQVERYLEDNSGVDLWSDFEARLGTLDVSRIDGEKLPGFHEYDYSDRTGTYHVVENHPQYSLSAYSSTSAEDNINYWYSDNTDARFQRLTVDLNQWFKRWVESLDQSVSPHSLLPLDREAHFLTFNYTDVLQGTYGVGRTSILHIHGRAADHNSRLIYGHGKMERTPENWVPNNKYWYYKSQAAKQDEYLRLTCKQPGLMLDAHKNFFENIRAVKKIYVLGHSLAQADHLYFRHILKACSQNRPIWHISYFGAVGSVAEQARLIGIPPSYIKFFTLSDLARWGARSHLERMFSGSPFRSHQ